MCELLWTDPQEMPGRGPSKRVSFLSIFSTLGVSQFGFALFCLD